LSRMAVGGPDAGAPRIAEIVVVGGGANLSRAVILARCGLKVGMPATDAALLEAVGSLSKLDGLAPDPRDPRPAVELTREIHGTAARVVIQLLVRAKVLGINITGSGPIPPAVILEKMRVKVGAPLTADLLQEGSRDI